MNDGFEGNWGSLGDQGQTTAEALSERGGIVTARGTAEGLVVRLDGRVDVQSLRGALSDFMVSRRSFLAGQEVTLEWIGLMPDEMFVAGLTRFLGESFDVRVKQSRLVERTSPQHLAPAVPSEEPRKLEGVRPPNLQSEIEVSPIRERATSLFDGMAALGQARGRAPGNAALWDDADARIIYTTVRSGQKIESEHSIVVLGDLNSGGELIAGGDIVVLGNLRGVAHAGAYDETGGGRVIFALNMQPTQLRIGSVISRGAGEGGGRPEVARIDGASILVEQYQSKASAWRRKFGLR